MIAIFMTGYRTEPINREQVPVHALFIDPIMNMGKKSSD